MSEERFQDGIGDGVFSKYHVNLFKSKIDLFEALAEGFHLLS